MEEIHGTPAQKFCVRAEKHKAFLNVRDHGFVPGVDGMLLERLAFQQLSLALDPFGFFSLNQQTGMWARASLRFKAQHHLETSNPKK